MENLEVEQKKNESPAKFESIIPNSNLALSDISSSVSSSGESKRKKIESIIWSKSLMKKDSKSVYFNYSNDTFSLKTSTGVLLQHIKRDLSGEISDPSEKLDNTEENENRGEIQLNKKKSALRKR